MQVNTKVCTSCNRELELDNFCKQSSTNDGLAYQCKECKKKEREKYKNKHMEYKLKYNYSITKAEYNEMYTKQRGLCAICGKQESSRDSNGKPKYLAVDHHHTNGEVRGLLCSNCNTGIGLLGDNIDNLKSAIKYLEERGSYGKDNN